MFAGPNGSGKSTMKSVVKPNLLGLYITPDELEVEIVDDGFLDLNSFGIADDKTEVLNLGGCPSSERERQTDRRAFSVAGNQRVGNRLATLNKIS